MEMDDTKTRIREFVGRYVRNTVIADDENLFTNGHVNSLFVMQLVLFVEENLGVPVADEDLEMENFHSIDAVAGFAARKMSAPAGAGGIGATDGDSRGIVGRP